jgi:hypothetical protein
MRWYVFRAQDRIIAGEVPFTLESALQFRHIRMIYDEGMLPEVDHGVETPTGVQIHKTYTIFAEYIYAGLAKLLPAHWSLAARVRWIARLWFCAGIPLMALWVRAISRSWAGGFTAGFFYAVSIAAISRSTGQELSHENFALPLLLASLAAGAWSGEERFRAGGQLMLQTAAALLLAAAMLAWDMIQFYLYGWMLFSAFGAVTGSLYTDRQRYRGVTLAFGGILVASVLSPYLRAHGVPWSPLMALGWGILLLRWLPVGIRRPRLLTCCVMAALVVFSLLLGSRYGDSYGHFAELLVAKLRFLNIKPEDPAALSFIQRIMWTPALNSADWELTLNLFPAILPLSTAAVVVLVLRQRICRTYDTAQLIFFYILSLLAYVLFVRFHVYVVLFAAALLGCWMAEAAAGGTLQRWGVAILLLAGGVAETSQALYQPLRWGRPGVYYDDLRELVVWLNGHVEQEAVLANFGTSASVLTYTGNPVLLHPKFEEERIRNNVEEYGNRLFKGDERRLRDWADGFGVRFLVYSLGEFSTVRPDRQMRYFVDALEPPEHAAARLFEYAPERSRWFRLVWENRKYRVFDMLTVAEEQESAALSGQAYESLYSGHLDVAEQLATDALKLNLNNEEAQQVIVHVSRLRDQGVELD